MSNDNPWETHSSETVHKNPWFSVREDKVTTPDGSNGLYYVIRAKDGVIIIAEADDQIYLLEAFRYPVKLWQWELPTGGIDIGQTPLQAAKLELREEVGLHADTWKRLGRLNPSNNGPMKDSNYVFLARGLHGVGHKREAGEAIRACKLIPKATVFDMVRNGELNDGQTLSALMLYVLHEQRVKDDRL